MNLILNSAMHGAVMVNGHDLGAMLESYGEMSRAVERLTTEVARLNSTCCA